MRHLWLRLFCASLLLAAPASAQYKLTLNFQGMTPHVNQRMGIRVVDKANDAEVARHIVTAIPAADFSRELYALVEGHSYFVDFYADFNGNGVYDAPPADHAWRLSVDNVTQDTEVNFTHNTNFTDIEWPGPIDIGEYEAEWLGVWKNLTFGSTDSIRAVIRKTADSLFAAFTTKGVFGDPKVVTFDFREASPGNFDWATDTLRVQAQPPYNGEVTVVNGQINGGVSTVDPTSGITFGLDLIGSFGPEQLIVLYTVTSNGIAFANGYVVVNLDTILVHIPTAVEEDGRKSLPGDFALLQNYPNPFNPQTTIGFRLPRAEYVTLRLYDLRGREVATLVDGPMPAGRHTVRFDATNLPSGVYVYRLEAGGYSASKKLLLVR